MVRALLALTTLLLLSACAELPFLQQQKTTEQAEVTGPPAPTSLSIDQALNLKKRGNWADAIKTLEEAQRSYPGNRDVASALNELKASWKGEQRLLEDRMLVIEVAAVKAKLPLLDKLANGDPQNERYQSRRKFWKQYLQSRVNILFGCGLYHRKSDLWLASRCLKLADEIAPSARGKKLLQDIASEVEQSKQASIERKQERAERRRERKLKGLLQDAENDMARGAYSEALVKLDEAQRRAPEHPQVKELLAKVQTTLSLQVTSLMELGDRLYREEQIGPAVAVWETALELDPNHQGISEKIDRARRVLEKLESIRSRAGESE